MRRQGSIVSIFVIFLIITLSIFFLSRKGLLTGLTGTIQLITVPVQRTLFSAEHTSTASSESKQLQQLRDENQTLTQELVKEKELEKENTALHDQFQTTIPAPQNLIPAHIIAMNGFLPGVSQPEELLLDQGSSAGVKRGAVVVVKNNFIGTVTDVSPHAAKVALLTQKDTSFTAQTLKTSALGIVRSQDNSTLLLDNVVLSDTLNSGDLVVTKGDSGNGVEIPANLVVGKIASINKQNSSLFQSAQLESLVDVSSLEMVFVMTK